MFNPKAFTTPKQGRWQLPFIMMFKALMGTVNIPYSIDNAFSDHPYDTCLPKDWDVLLKTDDETWSLAIIYDEQGRPVLNVDTGTKDDPWIDTIDIGHHRTLLGCFLYALRDYYRKHDDTHFPSLHESWYSRVEEYDESAQHDAWWRDSAWVQDHCNGSGSFKGPLVGMGF